MATLAELISTYNQMALAQGLATRKSFDNKAKAEAAIAAIMPAPAPEVVKVRRPRQPAPVRLEGPRGFRTNSPAWVRSIMAGKGVAFIAPTLPKLIATAKVHGVNVPEGATQAEIGALIANALKAEAGAMLAEVLN